ncbi:MAG: hypothetical protein ACREO5_06150, partial [Candidatus Binatia bacterium]
MDITSQLTQQDLMYFALIGAGIGLLLGLVPLVVGIRKGKVRLGVLAAVLSTLAGAVSPLLSVIVIVIFLWLTIRKGSKSTADTLPSNSDST